MKKQKEVECAAGLIFWLGKRGWKCYIEKGTKKNEVNEREKTVILDIMSENFERDVDNVKMKVSTLETKQRIKAASGTP